MSLSCPASFLSVNSSILCLVYHMRRSRSVLVVRAANGALSGRCDTRCLAEGPQGFVFLTGLDFDDVRVLFCRIVVVRFFHYAAVGHNNALLHLACHVIGKNNGELAGYGAAVAGSCRGFADS